MTAPQDPTRARLLAAVAALSALGVIVFLTATGLGHEIINRGSATAPSIFITLAIWGTIIAIALFVLDTAIGYVLK